ncbi:MAG: hypothetical protein ABEJ40_09895 [Haloarculaceae archaeon]
MTLSALDSIDDAVEATKRFLLPFDRVRWFRLAAVVFFVGGLGVGAPGLPTWQFNVGPETGDEGTDPGGFGTDGFGAEGPASEGPGAVDLTPRVTPELVALALGAVVLLLALWLLWSLAGAVMEFVFVESLRRDEMRLREPFRRYWRQGARLFVFRLLVWLATVAVVGAVLLSVGVSLGGWPVTGWGGTTLLAVVLLAIPLFGLAGFTAGNLLGFTTVFVVPVMLVEDRGVLSAWRRFWPTLSGNLTEYLVYAVAGFLLGIVAGIAVAILSLVVALLLAIPFAVVGVPLVFLLGLTAGGALVALVLGLMYVVVVVPAVLLVKVPFQTFLRYYALFVLGDTESAFDVIPDARAAVRGDGGGPGRDTGAKAGANGGDAADGGERSVGADDDRTGVDDEDDRWSADGEDDRAGDGW